MTTRNKILLSVGAVCLVAVIAVVAVVAVFAARTQNVTSSITVKYTAQQVVGSVSANYYVGNGTAVQMRVNGQAEGGTTLQFAAGNTQVSDALSPTGNIEFAEDQAENKLYVVFEYIFVNSGEQDYTAKLTFDGDLGGFDLYAYSTDVTPASWTSAEQDSYKKTIEDSSTEILNVTVEKKTGENTEKKLYVVINLDASKSGSDTTFNGSFAWNLAGVKAGA